MNACITNASTATTSMQLPVQYIDGQQYKDIYKQMQYIDNDSTNTLYHAHTIEQM